MNFKLLPLVSVLALALAACSTDGAAPKTDNTNTPPKNEETKPNPDEGKKDEEQSAPTPEIDKAARPDDGSGISQGGFQYIRRVGPVFFDKSNSDSKNDGSRTTQTRAPILKNKGLANFIGATVEGEGADEGKTVQLYLGKRDASDGNSVGAENATNVTAIATPTSANPTLTDAKYTQAYRDAHKVSVIGDAAAASDQAAASKLNGAAVAAAGWVKTGLVVQGITGTTLDAVQDDKVGLGAESADQRGDTTRVFGRNFRGTYDDKNGDPAAGATAELNSYVSLNAAFKLKDGVYGLAVEPITLKNVQYGRVTGDLSRQDNDFAGVKAGEDPKRIHRAFAKHFADNAVSWYFYRGVDATTAKQMTALSDATITYKGHALTYGLDDLAAAGKSASPRDPANSFDDNGSDPASVAVGNFVELTYTKASSEVKGSVYNIRVPNVAQDNFEKDTLVNLDGKVNGNTITGKSELNYTPADGVSKKGSFHGTFYGKNADEVGGAFNSITANYGKAQWGGVFGAQRTEPGSPKNPTSPDLEDKQGK